MAARLDTLTYPDSEVVSFGYDVEGFLASVSGVATQILWNARGQVTSVTYANNVGTTQTYDGTLDALDVVTVTGPQGAIYGADYGYKQRRPDHQHHVPGGGLQTPASQPATRSPIASAAVRPGDSMPIRFTKPGRPAADSSCTTKSRNATPGPASFGRTPA